MSLKAMLPTRPAHHQPAILALSFLSGAKLGRHVSRKCSPRFRELLPEVPPLNLPHSKLLPNRWLWPIPMPGSQWSLEVRFMAK